MCQRDLVQLSFAPAPAPARARLLRAGALLILPPWCMWNVRLSECIRSERSRCGEEECVDLRLVWWWWWCSRGARGDEFQVISPPPAWLGWNGAVGQGLAVTCRSPAPASSSALAHASFHCLGALVVTLSIVVKHCICLWEYSEELTAVAIFGASSNCTMAGTLAAAKRDLRKKIRHVLKHLPEAAAASQSMHWSTASCC